MSRVNINIDDMEEENYVAVLNEFFKQFGHNKCFVDWEISAVVEEIE